MNVSGNIQDHKASRLLDLVPAMIGYMDASLRIHYANASFARLLDCEVSDIIGQTLMEIVGPDNFRRATAGYGTLNGDYVHFEAELLVKGGLRAFEFTITPDFEDENGNHGYSVLALPLQNDFEDAAQQKRGSWLPSHALEEALQESEHRYHELIEKLPVAIYTVDEKGYIQTYNRAAVELWGREPVPGVDRWCGSSRLYHVNGDILLPETSPMATALKEARTVNAEEIIIERPDGRKVNVLPYPQPVFTKAGTLSGAINMLVNISERKKFEEKNAMLAAIVESSDDAIVSKTLQGIVTSWNTAAEKIFGFTAAEMIGESITKIIPPDRLHEEPEILSKLGKGEKIDHFETERIRKDGTRINISVTISPVKDGRGRIIGASKIARDITGQKRMLELLNETETRFRRELEKQVSEKTEDIKLANLRLERSNQELERFAYVASHDLQEPLRKIQAFGDLLLQRNGTQLSETGTDYLNRMIKAATRMQNLIEALLDFSRTTTLEKKFERKNLTFLAAEVKKDFQDQLDEKHATIIIEPLPEIEVIPFQFKQMLSNIVSNSLKYVKPDEPPVISITAAIVHGTTIPVRGVNHHSDYCRITIRDNGIGFDNENAERIFELFQRLHGRYEYAGSGIGLSICKKIAENHKGFIIADGKKEVGASFYIYIPVSQQ